MVQTVKKPEVKTGSNALGKLAKIEALDFSNIKMKLMQNAPEGKGWSQDQANEAEKWYKRFLTLAAKYPDHIQVPNGPIDEFWHQHILDTRAYARDCKEVFGRFIHHYPYYGLKGDAQARDNSFDETNSCYKEEFGEDCTQMKFFNKSKPKNTTQCNVGSEESFSCGHKGGGNGCSKK